MRIAFHRSYSEYLCYCWNNAATFEVEERNGVAGSCSTSALHPTPQQLCVGKDRARHDTSRL